MGSSIYPFIDPFDQETSQVPLLREAFDRWKVGEGIFNAISRITQTPWATEVDPSILDIEYFGNRSGAKFSAPIVMQFIGDDGTLDDPSIETLAQIIWSKYSKPWTHLWETNVATYNPIHNYDMTDRRELTRGESEARRGTSGLVDTTEYGRGEKTVESVYGMNTTNPDGKPANSYETQTSGEDTTERNGNTTDDSVRASNEVETTIRSGNIGVTTTQQMLTSERELWKWNFFDNIYKDIDAVLALQIYDPCRV